MDETQERFEQAVGDQFIDWLNTTSGFKYTFKGRGNTAPDLIYSDGQSELGIEITSAYYDSDHAKMQWQLARKIPDAPTTWSGMNFDERLAKNIESKISEKCINDYGPNSVLIVFVRADLTFHNELVDLLNGIHLPTSIPFSAIYLLGLFPVSSDCPSGYQVIPIKVPANS